VACTRASQIGPKPSLTWTNAAKSDAGALSWQLVLTRRQTSPLLTSNAHCGQNWTADRVHVRRLAAARRISVPVAWERASNEAGEAAIRTGPASGRGQRQHRRHEFMHGA
jgi:hypothetical protein